MKKVPTERNQNLKSPSIPLYERGKKISPPFGKGRLGGIL
jgi:hypothetical protein